MVTSDNVMFDRIGGEPTIRRLVDTFHREVLRDAELQKLFMYGTTGHVEHLTAFFVEMFGGPRHYSEGHGGIGGLYEAHRNLEITEAQRVRFVEVLMHTVDVVDIFDSDEELRRRFRAYVEAGSIFSTRFSQAGAVLATPYPEVEPWRW